MLFRSSIHFLLCNRFGEEEEAMEQCNNTVHGLCGKPTPKCTTIDPWYSAVVHTYVCTYCIYV